MNAVDFMDGHYLFSFKSLFILIIMCFIYKLIMIKKKCSVLYIVALLIGLSLSACVKGKDCTQLYQHTISFENRIARDLKLEFVDSDKEPYSVDIQAMEIANHKIVKEFYQTHEGSVTKAGMPLDGECTSEAVSLATGSFLSERSFGEVKNCWDNDYGKSIIMENSDSCPNGTFEQKNPGPP